MGTPTNKPDADTTAVFASRRSARVLAAIVVVLFGGYLAWRFTTLGTGSTLALSVPLFVLECWAFGTFCVLAITSWRDHLPVPEVRADLGAFPLVDTVVDATTGNAAALERTLVGLSALRGVGRVHVVVSLDSPEMTAVTERFDVPAPVVGTVTPGTIGELATSPLVLWLEAGQITTPELLEATVARFDDPDLAVCQLAVGLLNAESLLHLRRGGDREALVRDTIGPSLAAAGSGPWFGAGSIVRRGSLASVAAGPKASPETCRRALLGVG